MGSPIPAMRLGSLHPAWRANWAQMAQTAQQAAGQEAPVAREPDAERAAETSEVPDTPAVRR
jgi:hypothetical protein